MAKQFDIISVGSDQVWSRRITDGDFDDVFFLKGIEKKITKMSYAASAGGKFASEDEKRVADIIQNFDFVSVREESLARQLSSLMHKSCEYVMDPVFLLDKSQWEEKLSPNTLRLDKHYILVYNVSTRDTVDEYFYLCDEIARKLNCEIYEVGDKKHTHAKGKVFSHVGPVEFMRLISGADFVFTTSFHATAMAIIFEKQFNVFLPNNAKRITDMLHLLDLDTKLVSPGGKPDYGKIDYSQVTGKKYEKIKTSKEYINMVVAKM